MSTTDTPEGEVPRVFNVKRAEEVLQAVLSFPNEHRQEQWFAIEDFTLLPDTGSTGQREEDGTTSETRTVTINSMLEGSCGTSACIAGWASLFAGWQVRSTLEVYEDGWEHLNHEVVSPQGEVTQHTGQPDFEAEGALALGLSEELANQLFFVMDERHAIIELYSLIKFGEMTQEDLSTFAEGLGIEVDHEDQSDEYPDELLDEIVNHIRSEYPTLSLSEWSKETAGASADSSA